MDKYRMDTGPPGWDKAKAVIMAMCEFIGYECEKIDAGKDVEKAKNGICTAAGMIEDEIKSPNFDGAFFAGELNYRKEGGK